MNKQEADILRLLRSETFVGQRELAKSSGYSLGIVTRSLRRLIVNGYLDLRNRPTEKAEKEFEAKKPKNAVILAAGYGMRMAPIGMETPKALLEVKGEVLIERLIRQLHEAGIREIYVVVGFMLERFEYLIDEFGVELVVNSEYAGKNNLHSLALVAHRISNTYVVPGDLWFRENPFCSCELYSWFMVSSEKDIESAIRVNRKQELVFIPDEAAGNAVLGAAYLSEEQAVFVRGQLVLMDRSRKYEDARWEKTLRNGDRMFAYARVLNADDAVNINTFEQLRELDSDSSHLHSDVIAVIAGVLQAEPSEVKEIDVLKKGMTNRSFRFSCRDQKYIMRIPGEGTDNLVNRHHEAAVFEALKGRGLCDDPIYINPETGYKITAFLEGVRNCDPLDEKDLKRCMALLRRFHQMELQVPHEFDIFGEILNYQALWGGTPSIFKDHAKTQENIFSLKPYIDAHVETRCLTHIDAVPDNFLFYGDENGQELLQLTDWEYAGMQDPHVDIAMFCIYSLYDRAQVDRLIDIYFNGQCPRETRVKIYCYIAACGLLWSNWCEYKRSLGVEFGEYALRQYRYAKEYYKLVQEMLEAENALNRTEKEKGASL